MSTGGEPRHLYVIYLLGYPGVGKYTIATEIGSMTGAVVVDNQLINQPVLALLNWDGLSKLPPEIWQSAAQIREVVLKVMEDLAPRSISYVLTNALEDDPQSDALFHRIRHVAAARGSVFLPVVLTCDPAEQARRVTSTERRRRLKVSDAEQLRDYMATTAMYAPTDPNLLVLDTTHLTSTQAAEAIVRRANELAKSRPA
jgi:shikimate kinase